MSRSPSRRLDRLLVDRGLFATRNRAQDAIADGIVFVDGHRALKAGAAVPPGAEVEIRGRANPYVSRGGLKLEHALDAFGIDVGGMRCLDVGASAGGFTDCLLSRGATSVTAVDVGTGQLHPALRSDPRVTVIEGTDIRAVALQAAGGPFPTAVVDVSFIPLARVLGPVGEHLCPAGRVLALIKPQFEAGPGAVGKKGVIRDPRVLEQVIASVAEAARRWYEVIGVSESPVRGDEGNREFFIYLIKRDEGGAGRDGCPDLA